MSGNFEPNQVPLNNAVERLDKELWQQRFKGWDKEDLLNLAEWIIKNCRTKIIFEMEHPKTTK